MVVVEVVVLAIVVAEMPARVVAGSFSRGSCIRRERWRTHTTATVLVTSETAKCGCGCHVGVSGKYMPEAARCLCYGLHE